MSERQVLLPNAEHPITVEPASEHVRVSVGNQVIAETDAALVLREASYPPVYYVPRVDLGAEFLTHSGHHTYCPYKGEASYHGIAASDGSELADKVWYYDEPYPAVADIAGHVAFYPDAVRIETTTREG